MGGGSPELTAALSSREGVRLQHTHSETLKGRGVESTFSPERSAHTLAEPSDKSTDGTQRCSSYGITASIIRQKTKP